MENNFPPKRSVLFPTLLLGFFLYAHAYLPIYLNSSFLESLTNGKTVGLIFTIASILSIPAILGITSVLNKIGNYKTTILVAILEFIALLGLFFFNNLWLLLISFLLSQVFIRLLILNVDIFLESSSKDSETGSIRGLFLTLNNMALVTMPFAATLIVSRTNYQYMYLASAFFIVPILLVLFYRFKDFRDGEYSKASLWQSIARIASNIDLRQIYLSHLLLKVFFAMMVIYSPIYLHEILGYEWERIGVLFTIMLLPFVLFELPIGKLADWKFGEKEILSIGFIIMGLSTSLLFFASELSFLGVAALFFATRTGASAVEITSETYFFKKVSRADTDMIAFYRILDPLSYLIAPIIATFTLYLVNDYRIIFLLLGLLMLYGLRYSLTIKDTR